MIVHALHTRSSIGARDGPHSILGLGFSAAAGLRGFHSAQRFLSRGHRALIWVDGNGTLTVATYGVAEPVGEAIRPEYTGCEQSDAVGNKNFMFVSAAVAAMFRSMLRAPQQLRRGNGPSQAYRRCKWADMSGNT